MAVASDTELIRCPSCSAVNRVAVEKLRGSARAVCGRCKTPLPFTQRPFTLTARTFFDDVERSRVPVLVDFWAEWCGPCRMIAPMLDQLASELGGKARIGKLNIDENPSIADRFRVRSIPTLVLFKDGREVDRLVGVQPKDEILRRVRAAMDGAVG